MRHPPRPRSHKSPAPSGSRPIPAGLGRGRARRTPLGAVATGVALVAIVVVLAVWQPWRKGSTTSQAPTTSLTVTSAADAPTPVTPAAISIATPGGAGAASGVEITDAPSVTASSSPTPSSSDPAFDPERARQLMLRLVNEDRVENGLTSVAWDEVAAAAGQAHADDMAALGYMSHWNVEGLGPDHRYSEAGGRDYVQENLYSFRAWRSDGGAEPIVDWDQVIREARTSLMESPGHRSNILAPEHTHLGIGVTYNLATGDLRVAQEFVNRYVRVSALPLRATGGDRLVLRGELLQGSTNPVMNLAYEPNPMALTLDQLRTTGSWESPALFDRVIPAVVGSDGSFVAEIALPSEAVAGLYHVRVWVDHGASKHVPSVDLIVSVD